MLQPFQECMTYFPSCLEWCWQTALTSQQSSGITPAKASHLAQGKSSFLPKAACIQCLIKSGPVHTLTGENRKGTSQLKISLENQLRLSLRWYSNQLLTGPASFSCIPESLALGALYDTSSNCNLHFRVRYWKTQPAISSNSISKILS